MKTYLKIKIKSLAAEARIIRHEERKWPGPSDVRAGLHHHRIIAVRREARCALLAYAFLRGRRYRQLEVRPRTTPDWERVYKIVTRFHEALVSERQRKDHKAAFEAWADEALPNA